MVKSSLSLLQVASTLDELPGKALRKVLQHTDSVGSLLGPQSAAASRATRDGS